MKIFILIISFVSMVYTPSAFSKWSSDVYENHLKDYEHREKNTFVASMYGICLDEDISKKDISANIQDITVDQISTMDSNSLTIRTAINTDETGMPLEQDVVFFLPGVFNNYNSQMNMQFIKKFTSIGYHVVTFPDPWSMSYVKEKPFTAPGNHLEEMKTLKLAMSRVMNWIESEGLFNFNIRLVGVSHGAFLASMIYAENSTLPFEDLTLFSPPINLGATFLNLDKYIEESKLHMKNKVVKIAHKGLKLCKKIKKYKYINAKDELKALALVTYGGFQRSLSKMVAYYDRLWKINIAPKKRKRIRGRFKSSKKYRKWKKSLTYQKYIDLYSPDLVELLRKKESYLGYWLEKINHDGKTYRLLLSRNDFLNDNVHLEDHGQKQIFKLKYGGHFGYRASDWFSKLITLSF